MIRVIEDRVGGQLTIDDEAEIKKGDDVYFTQADQWFNTKKSFSKEIEHYNSSPNYMKVIERIGP